MYAKVSREHITPGVTLVSCLQQESEDSVAKQIEALFEYSERADEKIRLLTEVPSPLSYNFVNYGALAGGSAEENGEGIQSVGNHG